MIDLSNIVTTNGSSKEASATGRCISVIFNPTSGIGDPTLRMRAISEALTRHGCTCQFFATTLERGAKVLAQEAVANGADLIAVSGGDGTVMEVLSALVGTDIPVAVLPGGTGNLLSTNLGIPISLPAAVAVALSGVPYRMDLVRSGDRYFSIMGGMGLDGKVIEEADRSTKKKLGVLAYFLATARNIGRRRAAVRIQFDDGPPLLRRAKSVLIANMGKMTGGMEAIPTATPADGLLDIGIVKVRTPIEWLRLLAYGLLGRTQEAPELEVHQARRVRIVASKPHPIQFDGEEGGYQNELTAEIVPGAVLILLPGEAPVVRDAAQPPAVIARQTANRRLMATAGIMGLSALVCLIGLWLVRRQRASKAPIPRA